MSDFHTCRVCGNRWAESPMSQYQQATGRSRDTGLCEPCNDAARQAISNQTPEMREEQRRKRVAHFGNDGLPPIKRLRVMEESDL